MKKQAVFMLAITLCVSVFFTSCTKKVTRTRDKAGRSDGTVVEYLSEGDVCGQPPSDEYEKLASEASIEVKELFKANASAEQISQILSKNTPEGRDCALLMYQVCRICMATLANAPECMKRVDKIILGCKALDHGDGVSGTELLDKLGDSHIKLGMYQEQNLQLRKQLDDAKNQLATLAQTGSKENREKYEKALVELNNGHISLADKLFKEIEQQKEKQGKESLKEAAEAARHRGAISFFSNPKISIKHFDRATKLDPENPHGWSFLGINQFRLGYSEKAETSWFKALDKFKEIKCKKGITSVNFALGFLYHIQGKLKKAKKIQLKAIEVSIELGLKEGLEVNYLQIGMAYQLLGEFKKAEEFQLKAIESFKKYNKCQKGIALANFSLGFMYQSQGRINGSEKFYRKVLDNPQSIEFKEVLAGTYCGLGLISQMKKNRVEAESLYFKAFKIYDDLGSKLGIAAVYFLLGLNYQEQKKIAKAEKAFLAALEISEALKLKEGMIFIYGNLGGIYLGKGLYKKSEKFQLAALEISEKIEKKPLIEFQHRDLANLYKTMGNFKKAIKHYHKALAIAEAFKSKERMLTDYSNLGVIYHDIGEIKKAEACYYEALNISQKLKFNEGIAQQYIYLSRLYHHSKKNLEKAEKFMYKALKIYSLKDLKIGIAICYRSLGFIYFKKGELKKAEEFQLKALKINKAIGEKREMAVNYANLGLISKDQKNINKTCNYWQIALDLFKGAGTQHQITQTLNMMQNAGCPKLKL